MTKPRFRGRGWDHYPEIIDADGCDTGRNRAFDDFGMELPTYVRVDLVDAEYQEAYQAGLLHGEEAIRIMVLRQYGIDINRDPAEQAPRPKRVFWLDAYSPPVPAKRTKGRAKRL